MPGRARAHPGAIAVSVGLLPGAAADDPTLVAHLASLVNDVYLDAEAGLWNPLVSFAERHAVDRGHRAMPLELLVPRGWVHPAKQRLAGWYTRLGYELAGLTDIAAIHPALADRLATPSDVRIYRKPLTAP